MENLIRFAKKHWKSISFFAFGISVVLLLVGAFGFISNQHKPVHAAGTPFPAGPSLIFVSQGSPTRLYEAVQVPGTNTANFVTLGPVQTITYNAMGFNPSDMFLYAINTSTNRLIQIDSTGATTGLGPSGSIAGLPALSGSQTYNAGTIGTCNPLNTLWVSPSQNTTRIYSINVTAATPTATALNLTAGYGGTNTLPNVADMVCMIDPDSGDSYIWAVYGGGGSTAAFPNGIYRVDVTPGSTRYGMLDWFSLAGLSTIQWNGASFGAQWLYGNGNLGISNNQTGNIHQIIITDPASASPTFTEAAMLHGPSSSTNDGASYAGEPIDLGLTKTAYTGNDTGSDPTQYVAGANISYTLTVTNHSPNGVPSSGFFITDTIDARTAIISMDENCYISPDDPTGTTIICTSGTLAAGASQSFNITVSTPTTFGLTPCIGNTATVTGNEADPNPSNDTSDVQNCTAPDGYIISKTATASNPRHVRPGDTVTYTITLQNTGEEDYTSPAALAAFVDDMSDVLDDAVYNYDCLTMTADGSESCTLVGTTLSWNGNLLIGETKTVTYSVTVNDPDGTGNQQLNNVVIATGTDGSCSGECSTQTLVGDPEYRINKTVTNWDKVPITEITPDGTTPNDWLIYTIAIENTGSSPYTAGYPLMIEDDLSDVLDDAVIGADIYASYGSPSYREAPAGSPANSPLIHGKTLSWSGPLAIGQTVYITYMVRVLPLSDNPTGNQIMTNIVSPAGPNGPAEGICTDTNGLDACTTTTKVIQPNLKISVSDYTETATTISWIITAKNAGGIPQEGVTANLIVDALTNSSWSMDSSAGIIGAPSTDTLLYPFLQPENSVVPWNLGDMAPGQTETLTITIDKSNVTWDGDICITAFIFNADNPYAGDPQDHANNQMNNNDVDADIDQWDFNGWTAPAVNLKVSVSDYTETATTISWVVTAKNASHILQEGVAANLIVDAKNSATWTIDPSYGTIGAVSTDTLLYPFLEPENHLVSWNIGDMDPGQTETLTITIPKDDVTWDGDLCVTAFIFNSDNPYIGNPQDRTNNQMNNNDVDADTDQWDFNGWDISPGVPNTGLFGRASDFVARNWHVLLTTYIGAGLSAWLIVRRKSVKTK
ncbi:DUF11 domain-containing protein [Candidatus Saccharibacteria bacterium]|nr:DUF11 domain-containing protein [Candidatus Saccharibacteria bacterium]